MAFMLFSIDEAIDHKYIVNKSMREQAKKGTLIHVMDARETSDGVTVYYRINKTSQDFIIRFNTIKQFCKWCMPSTFLAKYYDKLSYREVLRYIRMENRGFFSFYLPVILLCLIIVWAGVAALITFKLFDLMISLIAGGVASVVVVIAIFILSKVARTNMNERLYKKVSTIKKFNPLAPKEQQ